MKKPLMVAAALLAASPLVQAGVFGDLASPFLATCTQQIRVRHGYDDMKGGWRKHYRDLKHAKEIRQCVKDATDHSSA